MTVRLFGTKENNNAFYGINGTHCGAINCEIFTAYLPKNPAYASNTCIIKLGTSKRNKM